MLLLLAALLALGGLPVTDDILARLERLESRAVAIEAQQRAMGTEMIRRRGAPDAMTERDVAALLSPRGLTAALGSRTAIDRTPDLATPLMARLRDDASLSAYVAPGRSESGYANVLADPLFQTWPDIGASAVTVGTGYTAIGPEWEAKYVLNSGTVATTRSAGALSRRSTSGYQARHSDVGFLYFIFGTAAADMTIYLRPTDNYEVSTLLGIEPSWLVASMLAWPDPANTAGLTATAYVEIVDDSDTLLVAGDSVDLAELQSVSQVALLEAAHDDATAVVRIRLRIDVSKSAGATADFGVMVAEPLLAPSDDGSAPAFTPAVGAWLPQQLVLRTYAESNIAAGATTTMSITAQGFPARIPEVWGGSIVGLAYRWSAAITGGTHSVIVQKNGVNVWTAFSGASAQSGTASQAPGIDTFDPGDLLTVDIVTGGGFLPAGTNDLVVDLYLLLDYDGD